MHFGILILNCKQQAKFSHGENKVKERKIFDIIVCDSVSMNWRWTSWRVQFPCLFSIQKPADQDCSTLIKTVSIQMNNTYFVNNRNWQESIIAGIITRHWILIRENEEAGRCWSQSLNKQTRLIEKNNTFESMNNQNP